MVVNKAGVEGGSWAFFQEVKLDPILPSYWFHPMFSHPRVRLHTRAKRPLGWQQSELGSMSGSSPRTSKTWFRLILFQQLYLKGTTEAGHPSGRNISSLVLFRITGAWIIMSWLAVIPLLLFASYFQITYFVTAHPWRGRIRAFPMSLLHPAPAE